MADRFRPYRTELEAGGDARATSSVAEFDAATRRLQRVIATNGMTHSNRERHALAVADQAGWHRCGRPSFKVHSGAALAFSRSQLTSTAEGFGAPFEHYAVCLPPGFGPATELLVTFVDSPTGVTRQEVERLEAIAQNCSPQHRGEVLQRLQAAQRDVEEEAVNEERHGKCLAALRFLWAFDGHDIVAQLWLRERLSLEESAQRATGADVWGSDVEYPRGCIRIGVICGLLAVNRSHLVELDLNLEEVERRAGRSRPAKDMAVAAAKGKCRNFAVGREIVLPRKLVEYMREEGDTAGDGSGRTLQHSFWRAGHLRQQPCGPGGKDRKIVWIEPHLVGEGLPPAAPRTYRITDDVVNHAA